MRGLLLVVTPLALVALVGAFLMLRNTAAARDRIESRFRRPGKPAKPLAPDHYYQRYWS